MQGEYAFRPVARSDYPMIHAWLNHPHIGGWWGDPDHEISLIEQDLEHGPTDMRIVVCDDQPFAFIQDYPAHHWPAPQFKGQASDARAIDTFLGDPKFLGRGHAGRYIHQRIAQIAEGGVCEVLTDPDPHNTRAIAAYRRAGFEPVEERLCEDGDPVLVMVFRRS